MFFKDPTNHASAADEMTSVVYSNSIVLLQTPEYHSLDPFVAALRAECQALLNAANVAVMAPYECESVRKRLIACGIQQYAAANDLRLAYHGETAALEILYACQAYDTKLLILPLSDLLTKQGWLTLQCLMELAEKDRYPLGIVALTARQTKDVMSKLRGWGILSVAFGLTSRSPSSYVEMLMRLCPEWKVAWENAFESERTETRSVLEQEITSNVTLMDFARQFANVSGDDAICKRARKALERMHQIEVELELEF